MNILGKSPFTSIAGYIVAGLMVAQELLGKGETSYWKIGIAVAIAVLGRVSADAGTTTN